jgi:hypothetical protein
MLRYVKCNNTEYEIGITRVNPLFKNLEVLNNRP